MNWNDKNSTPAAKDRIWKEFCVSENRDLKIFDTFREPRNPRPACSPVSVRSPEFLDRKTILIRSVAGTVLPMVRQRTLHGLISGGLSPSPSPSSPTTFSFGDAAPALSSPVRSDDSSPVAVSYESSASADYSTPHSMLPQGQPLRSPSPCASSPSLSLRPRPTSSQEIGAFLEPLHSRGSARYFHYGIRKPQLTPAYVVK
jgi:hypothetical protein